MSILHDFPSYRLRHRIRMWRYRRRHPWWYPLKSAPERSPRGGPSPGRKAISRSNPNLTPQELDVLAFLTEGKTNREIAAELNISLGTVKSHLNSLYRKLGVSNWIQAGLE